MSRENRRLRQREFVKVFNRLVGKYSPWQIWQDMVWMYACAIANSVPLAPHREKREGIYMDIVKRYEREELDTFVELIGKIINSMETSISIEGEYGDFLGELFMELGLGNNLGGQFFTPYSVCEMMAEVTIEGDMLKDRIKEEGYISVNDCACGAGATLIAFAQACREKDVNYQQDVLFVGQDIDSTTALMCYIQLSLLGSAGYVKIGDTLMEPMAGHVLLGDWQDSTWYTPMYFSDRWMMRQMRTRSHHTDDHAEQSAPPIATAFPAAEAPEPMASMPATASPPGAQPEALAQGFTVSARKKDAGQIMFDFG